MAVTKMIPKEAFIEYQETYKKVFGHEITYEEAVEKGTKLLGLYKIIYRPIPSSWQEELKKKYDKSR